MQCSDLGFNVLISHNFIVQGVYYYFYQIFRNMAEAAALQKKELGVSDGSVGMLSSLLTAASSG